MGDMSGLEMLFAGCAIFGGVLFLIRLILMFMGYVGHALGDVCHGDVGHLDVSCLDAHHASGHVGDTDTSFQILSLQGLTGFFMMFGLIGLAVVRAVPKGAGGSVVAMLAGLAAGLFAVWVITKLFRMVRGLQSNGTLDLANAVGQEGTVYLGIPAEGRGKAQITIQGRLQEFEAVSEKKVEVKTGERIRVVKVVSGNVVSVEKV